MTEYEFKQLLLANTYRGKVMVGFWSRDCDCCESTKTHIMKPSEVEKYLEMEFDNAEGPCNWWLVPPKDWKAAQAAARDSFRDRALEAFEDGHPHIIYD